MVRQEAASPDEQTRLCFTGSSLREKIRASTYVCGPQRITKEEDNPTVQRLGVPAVLRNLELGDALHFTTTARGDSGHFMMRESIPPQSEVIGAMLSEDSPFCFAGLC